AVAPLFARSVDFSLVAEAEAVFETVPQLDAAVVAFTWTVVLKPAANVVGLYTSAPALIDQPVLAGSIVQVKPAGSVSVKLTPAALPVPMLLSVTSKPMS